MFLALAICFLVFYNFVYAPRADRIVRQQNEISMWIDQLQQVNDSIKRVEAERDTVFSVSYSFDVLFGGAADLKLVPSAESLLRTCVTSLQSHTGPVEVIGHAGGEAPQAIRDRYPGSWDYGAAAAAAVASRLAAWGVTSDRIRVLSLSGLRATGATARSGAGSATPRLEIVVRHQ